MATHRRFTARRWKRLLKAGGLAGGALLLLGGLAYGAIALVGWVFAEAPIGEDETGRPQLNPTALEKLPEEKRRAVLEEYGRQLARHWRDHPEQREQRFRGPPPSAPAPNNKTPGATPDTEKNGPSSSERAEADERADRPQLAREDRRAVGRGMHEERRKEMLEEIDSFFKLGPEEQAAALDQRLDAMAARRAEWEKRRNAGGNEERRNRDGDRNGPPRSGERSEEQRLQHFHERLDDSSPEERAKMQAYFAALRARAEKRGIAFGFRGR